MQPLISILIPAYNAQEWIADTLRSAAAAVARNFAFSIILE